MKRGAYHRSEITEADVRYIRRIINQPSAGCGEPTTQRALARRYGVSPAAINKIVHGYTWKGVAL